MKPAGVILSDLIKGNTDYASSTPNSSFENLQECQSPHVTLVSCSDSRVSSRVFGLDPTNYIFHVRNIGNQIATSQGSVDYSVLHLRTPVLMVMGHTGCGAVKAALSDYSDETAGIRKELDSLKAGLRKTFDDEDAVVREAKYAELNVDEQVKAAMEKYSDLISSGKLMAAGAMMDFHDVYSDERGAVFITNINGETGKAGIASLESVPDAARESINRIQ